MSTAGCLSNYAEVAILNHIFNKATLAQPYIYVGLCTANPTDAGTGANCYEVPHTNFYERATAHYWSAPVGGFVENSAEIVFNMVTGTGWGEVSHFALFDAETYSMGNMIIYGALVSPKVVVAGSIPKFAIGEIGIYMD